MNATIKLKEGFSESDYMYAILEGGVIVKPFQDSPTFTDLDGSVKEYRIRKKSDTSKLFSRTKALNMFTPAIVPQCTITLASIRILDINFNQPTSNEGSNSSGGGTITVNPNVTPSEYVQQTVSQLNAQLAQEQQSQGGNNVEDPIFDILIQN